MICAKRMLKKFSIMVLVVSMIVVTSGVVTVQASSTTESFNTSTGAMNVDYSGYLSKNDLVFNSTITDPKQGIMVGNGKVGAQVWNANGLTMQFTGVDDSEQTCFSEGLGNIQTSPAIDSGYSTIQQRLSLYNGLMTTKYDSNRTVTIMGSPNSEIMGIHVDDSRTGVTSASFDLSLWDVSNVNASNLPDLTTWRTVSTYTDSNGAGLSRGQTDANNFGYTIAASVDGASFTTQVVNGNDVKLNFTPTSSYTIWIACASRLNAPNHDSVTQAKNLLTSVKSTGYSTTLTNYENWWHNFWAKSFVQYSNASGDADYMESMYYLSTYIIAAGAYGTYPFHFINGVFSGVDDNDSNHWSNAYWYWNQRDVYNSFFASNHADMMNVFNNMYSRDLPNLEAYTQSRFGISGALWAPETMRWDGDAASNDASTYTKDIMTSGGEAAQNMYLQYKYTNDSGYLSGTAYPFMKAVAQFYASKLTNTGGKYGMAVSNSHETYWDVKDAITDLAMVHALFPNVIAAAQKLGVDSSLVTTWQNILNNLDAYPVDPNNSAQYFPNTPPAATSHNNENVVCELLWPYGVSGIGASDFSMLTNNWNNRPYPYGNVWSPDAIQAARLGMGDNVYNGMKTMLNNYQNYPNARTTNTNGEFEYMGVHLSAMNEALLQSYNDKIRVFPAMPSDTNFVSKFTLLAKGGFLVSSEKEANDIKYVGINSLYGNSATVENPWGTTQLQVRRVSDNAIITTTSSSEFTFSTTANTVYVIERTSKLLSSYTYTQLTGTANQGMKSLSGTNSKLGSGASSGGSGTRYEAENGTLNSVSSSADSAASNGYEVTGFSATGASVTFPSVVAGNQVVIGYCTANNPGKLGLYINGTLNQVVTFPSNGVWSGSYATVTASATIPANASVKLQLDSGDSGTNIDYIQVSGSSSASKYEAETGTLANGSTVASDSAASGGESVENMHLASASCQINNIDGGSGGSKTLNLIYAASGTGTISIYVNGTLVASPSFPTTGGWSTYTGNLQQAITLNSGTGNNIKFVGGNGGINLDYITVQ